MGATIYDKTGDRNRSRSRYGNTLTSFTTSSV